MGLFFLSFCNSFTLLANKYLLTYLLTGYLIRNEPQANGSVKFHHDTMMSFLCHESDLTDVHVII